MGLRLHTVICSTRPGRVGPAIARWFNDAAGEHAKFDAVLVDLADFNLPLLDEPQHPIMQNYQNAHTKAWSANVAAADAYAFVTPEYNFGPSPVMVNAVDYLYREWNYKPCGFVSYGGLAGGARGVQTSKLQVTAVKMMPMVESVVIPSVAHMLNDKGALVPNDLIAKAARQMLDELHRWAQALQPMRAPVGPGALAN
jgi:NAD(P)H-dependent FMN reductase